MLMRWRNTALPNMLVSPVSRRRHPHRRLLRVFSTHCMSQHYSLTSRASIEASAKAASWMRHYRYRFVLLVATNKTAGALSSPQPVTAPSELAPAVAWALVAACFQLAKHCQTIRLVKTDASPTRAVLKLPPWAPMRLTTSCVPL